MSDRLEIKASITVDDAGEITGNAWPFDSPDSVGDIIVKGAFGSIGPDLPMLLGHDPNQPVGLWSEVRETDAGLEVKGKLFVDESQRARAVRSMVKNGLISGLSIGFSGAQAQKSGRNRVISKLHLQEISVVRNPAHPRARITGAKDATAAIAEAINRAAVALGKQGN
ncbi:HK97 family phage prohead protease [Bosea sp. RCC_152_1]|uniref:HK97 family phage prohead protease n=1 Tax=Bosea sp. RCC_152_1 TaxID=3239228 RepID=UPI0035238738